MPRHSRLARILQLTLLAQLALAAAWIAWRWPVAPLQALGGALLVPLSGPFVLAIEVVLLAIVDRSAPLVPRPTGRELWAAWLAESVNLFGTFSWRQPFRWRLVDDAVGSEWAGRTGVVFLHGFMCNRGFWNAWMLRMRQQGRGYVAVNLEPVFGSIDDYAVSIDEAVERVARSTGRPPLVVCHSMGGLAARAWWRAHGKARPIAGLVSIATPHGGTWMARFSQRTNGRQMRLRSDWLQQLARDELTRPLPPTTCWYSNCDNIVFPTATAMIAGANNRYVPGQAHVALAFHPDVLHGCMQLLDHLDTASQGESVTRPAPENG